jgi:hypothetical protein
MDLYDNVEVHKNLDDVELDNIEVNGVKLPRCQLRFVAEAIKQELLRQDELTND